MVLINFILSTLYINELEVMLRRKAEFNNSMQQMNRIAIFGKSVFAILRRSKREAAPSASQCKLLHICFYPNPPATFHYRSFLTLAKSNCIHL